MTGWYEPKHEWAVIWAGGDGTRLREPQRAMDMLDGLSVSLTESSSGPST